MRNLKSVVAGWFLTAVVLATTCTTPTTVVNSTDLSTVFDRTISLINYKPQLIQLISLPSIDSVKTYLMTQAPYVIPLWCVGGLTFVMLVGCCIQLCCYNCCGQRKCGTPISVKSFRPCLLSCCVYTFMVLSTLLMAAGVASFIISSDLIKQTNYSICDFNATLTDLFEGTSNGSSGSWSGVDNFNTFASQISTNFPNVIPTLQTMFTSAAFADATNNATNSSSAYLQAVAPYDCPTNFSNQAVSCPFSNLNSCVNATNQQIPIFSKEFCNTSYNNSAAQLVLQEQAQNSTLWQQSLLNLSALIAHFNSNPLDFSDLISQSQQLQSSITTYQPQLQSGIQLAYDNIHTAQIGIYGVLGLFLFMGLISFLSICCVYCTRSFRCRYLLYILWLSFAVLSLVFFIVSGILLMGTFVAYDSCAAYHQLTTNQTNFNSISYSSTSQAMIILDTCFFEAPTPNVSIFDSFSQQTTFQQIQSFQSLYQSATPSPTFFSVSSTINSQLLNYIANPNNVTLAGATAAQNPQAALDAANAYASNGGSNSCNAVNDTFVYNPNYCYPLTLNQTAGTPSCILIDDSSQTIINNRNESFISHNCPSNYNTYLSNFNQLNAFGNQIQTLGQSYLQDTGLATYTSSYFNYYNVVRNFMNDYTQSLFQSFLMPYQSLIQGSSCSYLTSSLNALVDNTCNNNFPYVYALSILVIIMSCYFFLLMIFAYFLTVRMEFYEYLDGDLSNYEEGAGEEQTEQGIEMADLSATNREKLLPAPTMQFKEPSSPERYPSPAGRTDYLPSPSPYSQYPPYQGSFSQYPPPPTFQQPSSTKRK